MKCLFIILSWLFFFIGVSAQKLAPDKYFIPFTDKNLSSFSTSNPEDFLSARAIERRIKYEIEVDFDDLPVNSEYIDSLTKIGFNVLGSSKWLNGAIVQTNDNSLLQRLKEISFILPFDYDSVKWQGSGGVELINRSEDFTQENYSLVYTETNTQTNIMNGNYLHARGFKGKGLQIAVMDLGFLNVDNIDAFDHLWESNGILGSHDFVKGTNPGVFSSGSHGTIVLSTMAALIPDLYSGTAPEASYYLMRTEDGETEYRIEEAYWLLAAEYADSAGVDIITSSLGYTTFDNSLMNYNKSELDGETALITVAAEMAFKKGILVITSAGNSGNKDWYNISFPADGKNVLSVGAIDTSLQLAEFSSRGPTADGRIKPEVVAVGSRTKIVNASGIISIGYGTSFSAPQVAGLVACLWQSNPDKSPAEIRDAVIKSSSKFFNPDNNYGYGIPDFGIALSTLNFEALESGQNIRISPNPFQTGFRFRFENIQTAVESIRIISSMGKIVLSYNGYWENNEDGTIGELFSINPGIYVFEGISSNGDLYRTKIIKY
jgi:serine protease AprX